MPSVRKPWLLPLYKQTEITSYDLIRKVKKLIPKPHGKIGHFGTLDPFAEGILVIAGDGGQRLNDYFHEWFPKKYRALGILGQETDTGDLTIDEVRIDSEENLARVKSEIEMSEGLWKQRFLGDYLQVPPIYSATKFEGKPLHYYARQGIKIQKDPVLRKIYSLDIIKIDFPYVEFEVEVSSGTYIRKLFEDMAQVLGTCGVLKELKRIEMGGFNLQNTLDFEAEAGGDILENALDLNQALPLREIILDPRGSYLYANGQTIRDIYFEEVDEDQNRPFSDNGFAWIFSNERNLIGLGEILEGNPRKLKSKINFPKLNS